jgi:DNA topoisomerase VI subunit B
LQASLRNLEAELNKKLRRDEVKEEESGAKPTVPNVVDEIIEILKRDHKKVCELSDIIKAWILDKLSN